MTAVTLGLDKIIYDVSINNDNGDELSILSNGVRELKEKEITSMLRKCRMENKKKLDDLNKYTNEIYDILYDFFGFTHNNVYLRGLFRKRFCEGLKITRYNQLQSWTRKTQQAIITGEYEDFRNWFNTYIELSEMRIRYNYLKRFADELGLTVFEYDDLLYHDRIKKGMMLRNCLTEKEYIKKYKISYDKFSVKYAKYLNKEKIRNVKNIKRKRKKTE